MPSVSNSHFDVEGAVAARYSAAAQTAEDALCFPSAADPAALAAVPEEVRARDYGCGNPSRYLHAGECVLDLGSGSGKQAFQASAAIGRDGHVIGVDSNDDMLVLARRHLGEVARRLGYANVEFRKGRLQDLTLDIEEVDHRLEASPIQSTHALSSFQAELDRLRAEQPLVTSGSMDAVLSSCVLNLIPFDDRRQTLREMHRVLRRGGRAIVSEIVADEDVPARLQANPELWTGCLAGAWREDLLLEEFERAGFYGIEVVDRPAVAQRTIEGIDFRSITVLAFKGKEGPCYDRKQAVIYRGPFRQVLDDDGHELRRGVPTAVCAKTFEIYMREPYRSHFEPVQPRVLPPLEEAPLFPCTAGWIRRDPRETKGTDRNVSSIAQAAAPESSSSAPGAAPASGCAPGSSCGCD